MKVCAIVTEYNPFHLGHEFQINETKKQLNVDFIIVVMSGNFVQRGEPGIFDKYTRAKLAIRGGADVVIELPTPFATSSAETFAYGAIELLNKLGVVDYLCFGSELGEIGPMIQLAEFLNNEPANFKNAIKSELKKGLSYAKARSNALSATFSDNEELLKGSNNILGIEYLKSLKSLHSTMTPFTIKRIGASYLSQSFDDILPSATAIRKYLENDTYKFTELSTALNKAMPQTVLNTLINQEFFTPVFMSDLFPMFKYLLEVSTKDTLLHIYDFPEELFNRLSHLIIEHQDYNSFIHAAVSKNYTKTTIQRALIHLYLNITTEDVIHLKAQGNSYCHILGFRKEASKVLHAIKEINQISLITNMKDHQRELPLFPKKILLNEVKYTNLYNQLIYQKYKVQKKNDYQEPIIVLS